MARIVLIAMVVSLSIGCGTFEQAATLDLSTNLFSAKKNKHPTVLREIAVGQGTLRSLLLVVSSTDYWFQMGTNLDYFDNVMTVDQFETAIIKAGLSDKIPSISDKIGLKHAYTHFQPYALLILTKVHRPGEGWFAGLALYDPNRAEVIFQNEIWLNLMWDGWTDQGTMFPLFNSLLEYLRTQ